MPITVTCFSGILGVEKGVPEGQPSSLLFGAHCATDTEELDHNGSDRGPSRDISRMPILGQDGCVAN